jgi:hypothetical protein
MSTIPGLLKFDANPTTPPSHEEDRRGMVVVVEDAARPVMGETSGLAGEDVSRR